MPMEPLTAPVPASPPIGSTAPAANPSQPVAAPATAPAPANVPAPVQQVSGVGPSGTPGPAAPVAAPAGTPDIAAQLAAITAEKNRLEAEVSRLGPYAQAGYKASLAQPAPAVAPAAAPAKVNALGVPELDPNIAFWVAEDAQGNLVERPGSPPGMLAAYQQHQRSYGQFLKKFASDPAAALAPLLATIKAEAAKEARESVMTEAQRAAQGRSADQIIQQNSNWAFEKDAAGNPVVVVDHLTGQQNYKYTEGGQLWVGHVQTLQKAGLTDPATIDKYAQAMTFFDTYRAANPPGAPAAAPGTAPAAPAAPAAPTNASLKDAFLNRIPGQNPSGIPAPPGSSAVPQSRKLSLSEQMMQDLAKAGYDGVTKLPMGQTQAA